MNVRACFCGSGWARSSAVLFGLAIAAFVACSDDSPPEEAKGDPADCRLIANRCHSYAPESDLAHECHETGHDAADPARCTELKKSCLDECPERDPDSGMGGSSGATSTGGSSGTTASGGAAGAGTGGAGASTSGGEAGENPGGASGSSSGGSAGSSQGGAAGSMGAAGSGGSSSGGAGMAGASGSGGTSGETPCELLGRLCHDAGPGRAEECHEIGHDGDESVCEEELADCLAVCADGGM
jgi:hypothetical protein